MGVGVGGKSGSRGLGSTGRDGGREVWLLRSLKRESQGGRLGRKNPTRPLHQLSVFTEPFDVSQKHRNVHRSQCVSLISTN